MRSAARQLTAAARRTLFGDHMVEAGMLTMGGCVSPTNTGIWGGGGRYVSGSSQT